MCASTGGNRVETPAKAVASCAGGRGGRLKRADLFVGLETGVGCKPPERLRSCGGEATAVNQSKKQAAHEQICSL